MTEKKRKLNRRQFVKLAGLMAVAVGAGAPLLEG